MSGAEYSAAVNAARRRRGARAASDDSRDEWFIQRVEADVNRSMLTRSRIAGSWLRDKIVKNISIPVVKTISSGGTVVVTERSSPGEFPRADTTLLMKTIFTTVESSDHIIDSFVGTPLEYGVRLEVDQNLDRQFMRRTFYEQRENLARIYGAPLTGI